MASPRPPFDSTLALRRDPAIDAPDLTQEVTQEPAAEPPMVPLSSRYTRSRRLYERACNVIPGGIHLSGRPLVDPSTTPMYFDRAAGCRIWDVDGHQYIDYLMAFGTYLLGYAREDIDDAARTQGRSGRLLSMNHPLHVDFIEALLERFPGSEMGIFFKTGSEATTAAVRIARRRTGRRRIARCGYHGWHDWCLPREDFVPAGLDEQIPEFDANRPETLKALLQKYPHQIAAVIVAPEMVLPHQPMVLRRLKTLAQEHGCLFVMDEVKTALRIAPDSVCQRVGIVPDMLTVSKAMGNGWPIAALLGKREVLAVGAGMHYSATFHGDVASMAAALATMTVIREQGVQQHVERLGQMLIDGLNQCARELDLPAQAYGEPLPPMPFFRFLHPDPVINQQLTDTFFRQVLAEGVLLHPRHMWFISLAHTPADIERTLEVCARAMEHASRTLDR